MAVAASGLRPDKLFQKYLYDPLGATVLSMPCRQSVDHLSIVVQSPVDATIFWHFAARCHMLTGMNGTTWTPARNPQFAFGITTTGSDFEKMLQKLLSYEFLGREVLSEMEKDWSAPPVSPCGDGWFGHYGRLACTGRLSILRCRSCQLIINIVSWYFDRV